MKHLPENPDKKENCQQLVSESQEMQAILLEQLDRSMFAVPDGNGFFFMRPSEFSIAI